MPRRWLWLQLLIGWLPVGVLFTLLVFTAHHTSAHEALLVAARMVAAGVVICLPLIRLIRRWPWPDHLDLGFFFRHVFAATAFALAFVLVNSVIESLALRQAVLTVGPGLVEFLVFGVWLYVMVAGVFYANEATARAARAEAIAARSQLAALRSQLNPHFLFNALHTVVHLIPHDPKLASNAAEQVAGLLRTTLEEDRDLVPLADELAFVRRYLTVERIRFGERLIIEESVSAPALDALVPVFALQTLVENAVRHGAAPRVDATTIVIRGSTHDGTLTVTVRDDGGGASAEALERSTGSGLKRLRERLAVLHGAHAQLDLETSVGGGFTASFTSPLTEAD